MAEQLYDEDGYPILPPLASRRLRWDGHTRCRTCRRPVIWLVTEANDKRLAVDATPTDDGTVEVLPAAFGEPVARVHGHNDPPPEGHQRYRVHAASCRSAPRGWRGRREKERQ
jgi:hypothetical protein